MLASDLIEVLCAAHLSAHVAGPYHERGGIMLVGPPGALKSTFLDVLDGQYHDAITMSDINARGLVDLRDQISSGTIKTLVLPELAKVYERMEATASNVEGTLRAMVAEGFQAASFEDQRVNRLRARAMVIAAMTPRMRDRHFAAWEESGFNRRFLWPLVRLENPQLLEEAVVEWKLVDFQLGRMPRPPITKEKIPNNTSAAERQILRGWVKYQPGGSHALQLQLMTKILCVLRWWYAQSSPQRDPITTLSRFAESLGRTGAEIEVPHLKKSAQSRSAETRKLNKAQVSAAAKRLAGSKKRRRR